MQDRVFYSSCFGFTFGILLRSFVSVDFYSALFLGLLAFFLILIFSVISVSKWGIILSVFVLTFSLGIVRYSQTDTRAPEVFENSVGESRTFTGIVVDEPDDREDNEKLTIEVNDAGETTKILTTVNFGEYAYGDEVTLSGKLKKPESFLTDTGKEFDYINYLRKDGILYQMSYPKIEVLSHDNGNFIKSSLFKIKEKFLDKMNGAIPSPENLLMGGLILGEKSNFSQDMRQSFVDTGTIHIVALSGYNVTIVAEWFMKLLAFLPQVFGICAGIAAVLLFVVMSGGSSTALRAGVMATLALVARATGRTYDVGRGLVIAGVVMLICNPMLLVYDVSFQLSFIATVAVIFLAPKVEKYFLWVPKLGGLQDIVSVTFAAYVFVLPFILYEMGNLSLVALPANILVLPLIPLTMLLGFITGALGLVWYMLAVPFGHISYFLLHYELGVIDFLSRVPFAAVSISHFPLWLTLLIYAWFTYALFGKNVQKYFTEPF